MVSFVLREHTLEITEDGISKRRVTQLNFSVRNLLHTESCIVQIYRVTDLIVPFRFLGSRCFHNFGRFCRRRFWLNRLHRSYGLPNFLQIVIGKPFVREVFCNAFRIYIVIISLVIPDCILAILSINYYETVIVYRSQHILTDISNLCGVFLEAVHNISNVFDIQFHKPTADNFCRTLLCTNANQRSLRANYFNDQLQNVIQHFRIVRVILLQQIHTELIREIIKVFLIPVILVHHSTISGRKDRISITKFSIFNISIITL